jgi:hypothetical protein
MAQGGGSISIGPAGDTTYFSDNMKSTTPQNYLTDVSNQLAADVYGHNAKGTAMDNMLLMALTAYQGTTESASVAPAVAGGTISTIA